MCRLSDSALWSFVSLGCPSLRPSLNEVLKLVATRAFPAASAQIALILHAYESTAQTSQVGKKDVMATRTLEPCSHEHCRKRSIT
jgi:hypothetical protein